MLRRALNFFRRKDYREGAYA
ncbi:MAG: hypothetical protein RL250_1059, partial [Verrucomicrobiota bacterium]